MSDKEKDQQLINKLLSANQQYQKGKIDFPTLITIAYHADQAIDIPDEIKSQIDNVIIWTQLQNQYVMTCPVQFNRGLQEMMHQELETMVKHLQRRPPEIDSALGQLTVIKQNFDNQAFALDEKAYQKWIEPSLSALSQIMTNAQVRKRVEPKTFISLVRGLQQYVIVRTPDDKPLGNNTEKKDRKVITKATGDNSVTSDSNVTLTNTKSLAEWTDRQSAANNDASSNGLDINVASENLSEASQSAIGLTPKEIEKQAQDSDVPVSNQQDASKAQAVAEEPSKEESNHVVASPTESKDDLAGKHLVITLTSPGEHLKFAEMPDKMKDK